MSHPPRRPIPLLGEVQLGDRAARAVTAELARHAGPKTALLVAVTAGSPVLTAALDGLLPGDTLTLVPLSGAADELRAHVASLGPWVAKRVRVVDALDEADPADVVVLAEPLGGPAEDVRGYLDQLAKHLTPGGVLSVAALALPAFLDGAAEELARQAAFSGVGTDLVLRNAPPVRVHRLRYTPAEAAVATRLTPAYRPSSVPLTRSMNIDSNGVAAAGIALGLAATARVLRPKSKLWLVPLLAAGPVAAFFRDPNRDVPEDESAVVAASDGTVLSVERLTDERLGDGELLRIAVFLSVLDVHVNRSPVAGKVVDHWVEDGGYAPAMKPAAEHNVAAYTVLATGRGKVAVAQRTGLIARRIVHRAPVGSLLAKGERFGLIRFGSRTDVYLPATAAAPAVAPGDKVSGGATVIARWR
ncbi:MAG: phosphatidylserine decarboxylase [Actinobacteria bacterium 13_2_20CM_2_71_6]|nr:MAG: phosphatidylserine decarboxylase [Actinobacteria bacterium 13_2_20CM_2_71_6]